MGDDFRKYSRQTYIRLIIGGLIILLVLGIGLIFIQYGLGGAGFGLICIIAGLLPVALIYLVLKLMDWLVQKSKDE